ncbi:hypothetical protein U5922_006360 [Aquicoccus sp. G2-2]|uniref:hypothetical protein n=1 Tax=Aquicoccus sp. G2-2 TaxID=3092120 RepID=UPI002AE0677B|nr:hypothetical protein [Aquicoccus sp. G2-2]MEA1113112.1 hypothetical protein [Aquicoccus sp. G2-2]
MSKNLLPVMDLANIATLPLHERRQRLEAKRKFVPPHSLEHTRRNIGMLLGVGDPLFPDHPRPTDDEILRQFKGRLPKGENRAKRDRVANLKRARALLEFSSCSISRAALEPHRAFPLAEGTFIRTADPVVLEVDGRMCIPSSDLRKSGTLSERALAFYFSINFHMIVDYDPVFADFDLVHLDYWEKDKDELGIVPIFHSGPPVYTYEDVDQRIRETLKIWDDVVQGSKRRSRGDDNGYWFGQTG